MWLVSSVIIMFGGSLSWILNMGFLIFGMELYRGMFRTAKIIRPFLWINQLNPAKTSILNDPWYFELPLAFKPTFLNMEVDYNVLQLADLLVDTHWNIASLHNIFDRNLNDNTLSQSRVTYDQDNQWCWFPNSPGTKVSTKIYSYFNHSKVLGSHWDGWGKIWKLFVAPRVKHFMWLMLHKAVKTMDYLFRLNLGSQDMCIFFKLMPETAEHTPIS